MTLAPLLQAGPAIQIHAVSAVAALLLGAVQLVAPKGTPMHRFRGAVWVVLMLAVSISSFFVHALRVWGGWSPIHLLSLFTLAVLPLAVWRAHRHAVVEHQRAMLGLYFGGLIVAGLFTFWPGRAMHAVLFAS